MIRQVLFSKKKYLREEGGISDSGYISAMLLARRIGRIIGSLT